MIYDVKLVKVNASDTKIAGTMELVTKTKCDLDKEDLEKRIDDVDKKIANASVLPKSVIRKSQIHNAIDRADKNKDKIKTKPKDYHMKSLILLLHQVIVLV